MRYTLAVTKVIVVGAGLAWPVPKPIPLTVRRPADGVSLRFRGVLGVLVPRQRWRVLRDAQRLA